MKGMLVAAGAQAKTAVPTGPVRSVLVTARAPISKQHPVFKSAKRPSVRTCAAEGTAPATKAQKLSLDAVKPGDEFEGRVTKVEQFGAFVDFGAAKDGLVHISQLSDKFVKNVASLVKVEDVVRVRVMTVDATSGRIALSMKGMSGAGDAEEEAADVAVEDEEDEDEMVFDDEEEESDFLEASAEGRDLITVDEEPELAFEMDAEDPEMTLESVAAFEALDADEMKVEISLPDNMPVPVGEFVSGKVTRVEDYGAFIEFIHNGKTMSALLEREEAKIPVSALTPEQIKAYQAEGVEVGEEYVDDDIESNMAAYYKIGDAVNAYVLDYNEQNKMSLTMYADWELDEAAVELAEDDEEPEFVDDEVDILAVDPLSLIEGEEAAAAAEAAEVDDEYGLFRAEHAAGGVGNVLDNPIMVFPRDVRTDRVNPASVSRISAVDTDFDGDEIVLDDYWTEGIRVPKSALKQLGLKMQWTEAGEPEIVEREGATAKDIDLMEALRIQSREARVAAFVQDLCDADEEEAELPVRAARRPVVMAAAVTNISATVVKELRNKTGA
eukprot:CAMPEP_0202857290 /NCGR_PEP_ID=MMETSP1391-20130828/291_1 /ASSEMBLY_ACC=CAM_ASM_000867 /TAXON_ID=1034604 /ORGANISM="Chlamydomonas leiostraca, Strain SAG 11-49" /LENGTH=553 /DNA_ID=CAMNT_0049536075 /DNA_START=24 /DNA_END=1682 /DNA_ORIENTATION=+